MNSEKIKSIIKFIVGALLLISISLFFFPLFFRSEAELPNEIYGANGIVSVSFYVTLFLTLIYAGAFLVHLDQSKKGLHNDLNKLFLTAFPSLGLLFLIYIFGLIKDPWLLGKYHNMMILGVASAILVVGSILFVFLKSKTTHNVHFQPVNRSHSFPVFNQTKFTVFFIVIMFALGLYLRWLNIGEYPPQVDEFTHLQVGIQKLKGISLTYQRAYWPVSVPIIAVFKIFGVTLGNARMTVSLINILAIVPLYFFMKRFGRFEAFFAVFMFTINPMVIAVSQITRDFAVLPLFIYITFYFTVRIITSEINGKLRDWIKKNIFNIFWIGMLTSYTIFDQKSAMVVILSSILVFTFIVLLKIAYEYAGERSKLYFLFSLTILFTLGMVFLTNKINFSELQFSMDYLILLTTGAYQNWSYIFPQIGWLFLGYAVYLLFGKITSFQSRLVQGEMYISLTFFALLTYVSLFFFSGDLEPRIRYYVVFIYYLIPIVALFFARAIRYFDQKFTKDSLPRFILILPVTFGLLVNLPALKIINEFSFGYNRVSGANHLNYEPSYGYIKDHVSEKDALISDQLQKYDLLYDNVFDGHIFINVSELQKNSGPIDEVLRGNSSGWIAKSRNGKYDVNGLPFDDLETEEFFIEYIGSLEGNVALWHFEEKE